MFKILLRISILKTIIFNFYYLKFKEAILFPILISRKTRINKLKGKIILNNKIKTGKILIGFGDVPVFDRIKSRTVWNVDGGIVTFDGRCVLGHGSKIGCSGKLFFGSNFQITAETLIICRKEIVFGENVLISWNCQIMDTDFHKIIENENIVNEDRKIYIGNHIWIGSSSIILKGTSLPDNSVVAAGSVVTREFGESDILIGGVPAKIIKKGITWKA